MASVTSTPLGTSSRGGRAAAQQRPSSPDSSSSPTRLSRLQEKDALRSLNDRLAVYIQRVQELQSERLTLLLRLESSEEEHGRERSTTRRLYEEELADVRSSLDELANEKARLQIELSNAQEENKNIHHKLQKAESDVASAVSRWRTLESTLTSRDSELSKQMSAKRRLEEQTSELQEQLAQSVEKLSVMKEQLKSEMVRRIDLENQVQTAREQLLFQKTLSEKEAQETRSRSDARLLELETSRRKEFETKLADTMKQLRQDHEIQVQQFREELDKTYSSKLQNAQQTMKENDNAASATKDQLQHAKVRLDTLSSQLQVYQREKLSLEARVVDLEQTLDRERSSFQQQVSVKDQELSALRSQMFSQLDDYEKLLDTKLELDMEINAYRKMLEVEEQRLRLSPSPSQCVSVSRTHDEPRPKLKGRKRKPEGPTGSSPAAKVLSRVCVRGPEQGPVGVGHVDEAGRFIQLRNNCDQEQSVSGWVVRRIYPDSGEISFTVPSPCVLGAGQILTIWAAGSEAEADSNDLVLEGHQTWGPATDVRIILLDPEQQVVCQRRTRIQARDEPDLDFEEFVTRSEMQHFRKTDPSKENSCVVM